jgi:hypothetical protein
MATRPNVKITQVEETPITTAVPTILEPVILGDLRQVVERNDTGSTYSKSAGTTVSYPDLETNAVPLIRFVDDRILGKHSTERTYSEWDLLTENKTMITTDLLSASDVIASLQKTEYSIDGTQLDAGTDYTLKSKPIIRDTVVIIKSESSQLSSPPGADYFAEGDDFTVDYDLGTISAVASGALDTYMTGATTMVDISYSARPSSSVVAHLQYIDTYSTTPFTTVTERVKSEDYVASSSGVTVLAKNVQYVDFLIEGTVTVGDIVTITINGTDFATAGTETTIAEIVAALVTAIDGGSEPVDATDIVTTTVRVNSTDGNPFSYASALSTDVGADLEPTITEALLQSVSAFPSTTNISIVNEAQSFDKTTLDSADVDVTLNYQDLISGTVSVTNAAGTAYTETTDWTVDLTTGVITLKTGGQIDDDDISVVFITYQAKYPGSPKILLTYTASRLSRDETLLRLSTREQLEAINDDANWKSRIGPENPLLFGMAVAQAASGGNIVAGTPFRSDIQAKALELLEKNDVYTLVLMSPSVSTASSIKTHVDAQSLPEVGNERVLAFSPETRVERSVYPYDDLDDTVGSGIAWITTTVGEPERVFDTLFDSTKTDATLGDPKAGDYIEILDQQLKVTSVVKDGTDITYYVDGAAVAFPTAEPSGSISSVVGTPDGGTFTPTHMVAYRVIRKMQNTDVITIAEGIRTGQDSRRTWMMLPDIVQYDYEETPTTTGAGAVTTDLPGFIRAAHVGGLRTNILANQALTNFVLTGFTGLRNSNDLFTKSEIDSLIQNGIDLAVADGTAVKSLRSLTTDASTLGNAEQSIVTTVDYGVKKLRRPLRGFLGVYNVTENTINLMRLVVHGVEANLKNQQSDRTGPIVARIDVIEIKKSELYKDRIEMKLRFVIAAPLNDIEVTVLF